MSKEIQDLIIKLELRLSDLALDWRRFHSQSEFQEADGVVHEYHKIMAELWKLGWDGEVLPPDSELPDELMPNYFLERWRKK